MRPPNSILALTRLAFRLPDPLLRRFAGRTPLSDDGTPLDPVVGAVLAMSERANLPRTHELSVAQARRNALDDAALVAPQPEPMASVEDRFIPGPAGAIRVRAYRPSSAPKSPLLVYLHGGGFVICDLDSHDTVCRRIARISGAVVVAVDYRLAPEHLCPAAVDDAEAALRWIIEHAESFGGDSSRVGVGGDSAGGNLSAVACRRLRDRGARLPKVQFLIYPATDMTSSMDSHQRFGRGFFLETATIDWFKERYLVSKEQAKEQDASPLFAKDLSYLPQAVVVTAGFDPLRDEGEAYANALRDAGVDVRFRCEEALVHAFINMAGVSPACSAALDRIARDVGELL